MKKKINKKLYEYYKNNELNGSIIFNVKTKNKFENKNAVINLRINSSYLFYSLNSFKNLRCNVSFDEYSNILYSLDHNNDNYYVKYCLYIFNLLLLCMIYKKEV